MFDGNNHNHEIAEVFYRLNIGVPIEDDLLARAFELILTSPHVKARDAQLGALLTGLMVKTPTVREVVTLIRTALNIDGLNRYKPTLPVGEKLVCVAGSGKKGLKTFNISTAACLVASAAGAYIIKPCSSATSSVSGSKDFIIACGARLLEPNNVINVLLECKFGIIPIEEVIPKFDSVYGGKAFGPTPLSFALPAIINPIACDILFYGLSHPNIQLAMNVFIELGYKNVTVVSSTDNEIHYIDELSTLKTNLLGRIIDGTVNKIERLSLSDITALPYSSPNELDSCNSLIENTQLSIRILQGKLPGPRENTVALNAAGILESAGKVSSLKEGYELALEIIRSGQGLKKLEDVIEATGGSISALTTLKGGIE